MPSANKTFLAAVGLAVFLSMLAVSQLTASVDEAILGLVAVHRRPALDELAAWVTRFGAFKVLGPVGLAVFLSLLAFNRRTAVFTAVAMASSAALMQGLKYVVALPRPSDPWSIVDAGGYSFPSGHSMASMTLALTMWFVFDRLSPAWLRSGPGITVIGMLFLFAIVIGLTRIYLGAHYPTDVFAGWALAVTWVILLDHVWWRR